MMMLTRAITSSSAAAASSSSSRFASRQLSYKARAIARAAVATTTGPARQHCPTRARPFVTAGMAGWTRVPPPQVSTVTLSIRASAAVTATGALFYNNACDVHALEVEVAAAGRRTATTLATAAAGVEGDSDASAAAGYPDIVLYQYKICPYCNKVKAVLDFLGVPYTALEVNPVSKAEIKGDDFDGYKKVPVCRIGGVQVNDSPVILSRILELAAERGDTTLGAIDDEQKRWMEWADRKLAVLLFPNITRSMTESMQAFSYIWDVPHFSMYDKVMNRYGGAVAMRLAQGKIKKKYDIDDERQALDSVVVEWVTAVGSKPFLAGDHVSVADLCVFGCLRAIEHMDTFADVLGSHPDLKAWYDRVAVEVGDSACTHWE